MASSVKSVSFTNDESQKGGLLEFAENQEKTYGSFAGYIKHLIKQDKEKGFKFTKEQEKAIIELIKRYAPAVKEEDIQKDFDKDQESFIDQF